MDMLQGKKQYLTLVPMIIFGIMAIMETITVEQYVSVLLILVPAWGMAKRSTDGKIEKALKDLKENKAS